MPLEHISAGFINVENERKEKLLLWIFDELCVSLLMPFLCTHLDVFVIVGWHEHVMSLFGLHVASNYFRVDNLCQLLIL